MFDRIIAVAYPILVIILSAFLYIRLKIGKNRDAGGSGLLISGFILIFLASVINLMQHLPDYPNWFRGNIYGIINIAEFLSLLFGLLLAASGLVIHFSFWGDRDTAVSNHLAKLKTLDFLQQECRQPMPMNELLERMLRGMLTGLEEESGAIFLLNQRQRQFILSSAIGLSKEEIALLEYYPYGRNLISQAVEDESPLLSHDFRSLGGKAQLAASRFRSILVLPLTTGRSRLGAVLFFSTDDRRYSREFINLTLPVASWIAEKIEVTRLGRELSKNAQETVALRSRTTELLRQIEAIFKTDNEFLSPDRFTEKCLAFPQFGEVWLLGLAGGKLQIYGGTGASPDFSENFRAALLTALARKKAVILNQEAVDESGKNYTIRSSLLLPADDRGNALLLRNEQGATELNEDELRLLEAVAAVAGAVIAYDTARRVAASKERDLDAVAAFLRRKMSLSEMVKELKASAEYIAEALGGNVLVLLTALESDRLKALYSNRNGAASDELALELGEASTGRVAVTGKPEFFMEPSAVSENIAVYSEENRIILNRLFNEFAAPSFQADYPILYQGRPQFVLTLFSFGGSPADNLERHRFVSVLVGLLNLKIEIASVSLPPPAPLPSPTVVAIPPAAANELNNDLAAISGYCQIVRRDSNLTGEIQCALDSMVSVTEKMSALINSLASGRESVPESVTDLNTLIRRSITSKSISGDLYMVAGRPTEVALNLKEIPRLGIGEKELQAFLDSVYSSFTENVTEDEIVSINTYTHERNIYFDISRHRKNFPPVEPVANFGQYVKPISVEGDLKNREFMRRLTDISGEFAYDRFSRYPSYFSFRFPVPSASGVLSTERPAGEITILAIDDQVVILELLAAMCQSMGHNILTATSAEEGWRLFEERRPDIIIADLVMPGTSGLELTGRLKKIAPEIPVILITGWGMAIDEAHLKSAGVDFILHKPFRLEQLSELISKVTAGFRP